jgi:uncharacterized protein with HEPN domain
MVRRSRDSRSGGAGVTESDRTDSQKLDDMRASILRLKSMTDSMRREEFLANTTVQEATAFRIMALGDAAGGVSKRTQNANTNIQWKRVSSFRHTPAHEYYDFTPENLWEFIQVVLPDLERKLRKIRPARESTS